MLKFKSIRTLLFVSFVIAIAFPLYNILFIYPALTHSFLKQAENEAVRVGNHMTMMLFQDGKSLEEEISKPYFATHIEKVKSGFNFWKIKVYTGNGEVLYSTDTEDVGKLNQKEYFHNIVAAGNVYSKVVKKDARSMEGRVMIMDAVETYIPIFKDNKFAGAFEIYYDITGRMKEHNALMSHFYFTLFAVTLGLLAAVIFASFKASKILAERSRLEDKLKRTAKELANSNSELKHFAYIASHDLQEPLRMISGFTQLLAKRYRNKLDPDADEFIEYIVDGTSRMRDLINGLLAYSRVGTSDKKAEPVDCNILIENVLINLQPAIEEKGAVVTHDPLPTVMADDVQLVQLFQNLISNAIKFHDGRAPEVHVSTERREDEWLFSIKDNGIGMDPQNKDRIFLIYQRLHARDEYPGTGIGLAICKKIVERHGGHICVDSKPGEGATFHFSIPA